MVVSTITTPATWTRVPDGTHRDRLPTRCCLVTGGCVSVLAFESRPQSFLDRGALRSCPAAAHRLTPRPPAGKGRRSRWYLSVVSGYLAGSWRGRRDSNPRPPA